jgi:hypothetical protein
MVAQLVAYSPGNHGNHRNKGSLWILRRVTSARETHVGPHIKCPLLSDSDQKWIMPTNFGKALPLMKIISSVLLWFHTDERGD